MKYQSLLLGILLGMCLPQFPEGTLLILNSLLLLLRFL